MATAKRDFGVQAGAVSRLASDFKVAANCLDPVLQADPPRPVARIGAADAVVSTTTSRCFCRHRRLAHRGGGGGCRTALSCRHARWSPAYRGGCGANSARPKSPPTATTARFTAGGGHTLGSDAVDAPGETVAAQ